MGCRVNTKTGLKLIRTFIRFPYRVHLLTHMISGCTLISGIVNIHVFAYQLRAPLSLFIRKVWYWFHQSGKILLQLHHMQPAK